jgi:hypothetical protein
MPITESKVTSFYNPRLQVTLTTPSHSTPAFPTYVIYIHNHECSHFLLLPNYASSV